MEHVITVISVLFLIEPVFAKTLRIYNKQERPTTYVIEEVRPEALEPYNPSVPYVLISHKDKLKLKAIRNGVHNKDPNLNL